VDVVEQRRAEAASIRIKYPERVPVSLSVLMFYSGTFNWWETRTQRHSWNEM